MHDAERLYRAILQINPNHPDANHNLGTLTVQAKQPATALPHLKAALEARPSVGQYWLSYINALILAGRQDVAQQILEQGRQRGLKGKAVEALAATLLATPQSEQLDAEPGQTVTATPQDDRNQPGSKRTGSIRATQLKPGRKTSLGTVAGEKDPSPQEINALVALFNQGRHAEAEALSREMTLRFPKHGFGWKALSAVLQTQGKSAEALGPMQNAVALLPGDAEAHNNLGNILRDLGRPSEAEACLKQALAIQPDYAEAHNNLGVIFNDQRHHAESEACYRRALEINPDFAGAHNNLGNILKDQGRLFEAEASFRRALQIKPDLEDAYGNLLFVLNYAPDKSAEEIFSAYKEYDTRFGLPHRREWRDHDNGHETGRRLKVGYVSPDFRKHSARHFLEPLLAHRDKAAVEVTAYAELAQEDTVTAQYKGYVDHWVPTRGMTDAALAERIRADSIDILVDLAGHTAHNRLQVFARRPAPISVSWMGYGYTTGLTAIDYLLTDAAAAPVGCEGLFSETPWRLDTPGYAYRPAEGMGLVSPLPAAERGYVTFGTLTRAVRINHRTIRVWSEILRSVPGSRLILDSGNFQDPAMRDTLAEKFAAHGIAREQLEIGYHSPPWDVVRGMDIGLDCFPHNSGTTLLESLYMGVPFVTLASRPSVGRLGSSILTGLGHPEWIALTEEDYITIAVTLAGDLTKLVTLRSNLRGEMESSPVMDEPAFARKVETAYREMWRKWCANRDA
jgi:predicted O-linked N-acetylglucosamine transferase (SPINDLY family)